MYKVNKYVVDVVVVVDVRTLNGRIYTRRRLSRPDDLDTFS